MFRRPNYWIYLKVLQYVMGILQYRHVYISHHKRCFIRNLNIIINILGIVHFYCNVERRFGWRHSRRSSRQCLRTWDHSSCVRLLFLVPTQATREEEERDRGIRDERWRRRIIFWSHEKGGRGRRSLFDQHAPVTTTVTRIAIYARRI